MPIDVKKWIEDNPDLEDPQTDLADAPDKYDEIADEWERTNGPKTHKTGGGGHRKKGSKTTVQIATSNIESSILKRQEEAKHKLFTQLGHFPFDKNPDLEEKYINEYAEWVIHCVRQNALILDFDNRSDVQYDNFRKSHGPGGQNVNKTAKTARFTHLKSGIWAESTEAESLVRNEEKARTHLIQKLSDHMSTWKTFLVDKDGKQDANENRVKELLTDLKTRKKK